MKDENYYNPLDSAIESGLTKLFRKIGFIVATIITLAIVYYFNS